MTDRADQLIRFLLPEAGVRGAHVTLDATWAEILRRADTPVAVQPLLGEALAASALLTAHTKVEGRLSVQLKGTGALRTLFAECTAAGTLRGIARLDDGATPPRGLDDLGEGSLLAITVENPTPGHREPVRYQGLVPLESPTLAGALEGYFRQSEQLPTRLALVADGYRCAGMLLQALPGATDADGWNRVEALFATLTPDELLGLPGTEVIHRLFHEEQPELLGDRSLAFHCSCSRERVADVLRTLGQVEAMAATDTVSGNAEITCEFCGSQHVFTPDDVTTLFTQPEPHFEAPERLQ